LTETVNKMSYRH